MGPAEFPESLKWSIARRGLPNQVASNRNKGRACEQFSGERGNQAAVQFESSRGQFERMIGLIKLSLYKTT